MDREEQIRRRDLARSQSRLLSTALWGAVVLATIYVLQQGKNFFVPLVIALITVYLIWMVYRFIQRLSVKGFRLPSSVALVFAFAFIFSVGYFLVSIVADNALAVANQAPALQARFMKIQTDLFAQFGFEEPDAVRDFFRSIDLRGVFGTVAASVAALLGNATLVFLYSLFLVLELRHLPAKIDALFPHSTRKKKVEEIIARIDRDIHTYVGVKTLISLITGALSYIVMRLVGLEFAEFWALLIFVLNFIPTIGSIISTILPTLFALVQFESLTQFAIIGIAILSIQQLMGTIIEPNLVGESLNLSPLVVIMSLIFWGSVWGIVGAFLCVPITVILVIILGNFEQTRPVAVLLSKTGKVRSSPEADT
jgi:AI-2 transport protein TqsA